MKHLARPRTAIALVGLYLLLYAGVTHIHRVESTDLPAYAESFAIETAWLVLWCLAWSAASWFHSRRDDLMTHLSVTALGGTICLLALYLAIPWAFYLLDLPWRGAYYELARLVGILLLGIWQWRIVTGRRPSLRLWAGISITLIGLQCVHFWAQVNAHEALSRLPFEANVVLPLTSPIPLPGLNDGLNQVWSSGWD
jgi:hypothetical protein